MFFLSIQAAAYQNKLKEQMALAAAKRAEEKQREQEEAAELRTILRTTARAEALMASAEARKKQEYIAQLNAQREEQAARYVRRVHTNMLWGVFVSVFLLAALLCVDTERGLTRRMSWRLALVMASLVALAAPIGRWVGCLN